MVQSESLRLYGKTVGEFLEWVYLDPTSDSGLRWRVTACSTAVAGSRAGTFSRTVKFPCWRVKIDKTPMVVSRIVWFLHTGEVPDIIDHRDGNPYNNNIDNLRNVPIKTNCENRKVANPNKVSGVYRSHDKYENPIWRCQGTDLDGKRWAKVFSVGKYGEEKAKELAINHRKEQEAKNNTQTREVSTIDLK